MRKAKIISFLAMADRPFLAGAKASAELWICKAAKLVPASAFQ